MTLNAEQAVLSKLSRLRHGGSPRVLDLFAGCGGLSLGFEAAGFEIAAAVEFDRDAAASHGANFHPADQADFERHGKAAPFRANDELLALQPACCLTLSRSLDEARADGSKPFGPALNLGQQAAAQGLRHMAIRHRHH